MTATLSSECNCSPGRSPTTPHDATVVPAIISIIFTGAIFGFFYAWVCSTMWAFDDADPRVAIEAMQAVNSGVRNAAFFPAFFLTPLTLFAAAASARRDNSTQATRYFLAAGLVYIIGGLVLTMAIHVPLNEELADMVVPASVEDAETMWTEYSKEWQRWNITRTVASGISLIFASLGLVSISRQRRPIR